MKLPHPTHRTQNKRDLTIQRNDLMIQRRTPNLRSPLILRLVPTGSRPTSRQYSKNHRLMEKHQTTGKQAIPPARTIQAFTPTHPAAQAAPANTRPPPHFSSSPSFFCFGCAAALSFTKQWPFGRTRHAVSLRVATQTPFGLSLPTPLFCTACHPMAPHFAIRWFLLFTSLPLD